MSIVHVNGINLYYEVEGHGDPLVLIAGYTVDLSAWDLVRKELSQHFQLFMFDNRGVGRSDCPDSPYTIDLMAKDTKAFIEALGLQKPYLLGHSMGGAIAQTLAFKYPETIRKLILANTLIKLREAPAFALRSLLKMRSQRIPFHLEMESGLPWFFSGDFLKNQDQVATFIKFVESYPYTQSIIGQTRQLEAIMQFNSEPWFKKIAVPTLVIEGSEDIVCPEDSKRLAEEIEDARLITFRNQAHIPHIETPRAFTEAVLGFIEEHAPFIQEASVASISL